MADLERLKWAIETLEAHNAWRRGDSEEQPIQRPKEIGLAMEFAIEFMESAQKRLLE